MTFPEHLNDLKYSWDERRDLEATYHYKEILPELQEKYPEIIKLWNDYKMIERILTAVIDKVVEENPTY